MNAATANASLSVHIWNQNSDETSNVAWWYGGGMAIRDVNFVSFNRRDDAIRYLAQPKLIPESDGQTTPWIEE
jgi:carboxylesterase 2